MKLLSGLVIFALVSLSVGQTCTGTQTFQNSSETFSSSSGNCDFLINAKNADSVTTITFSEFFLTDGEHVEVFFNDVSNANLTGQLVPPMIVSPKGVSVKLHFTPTTENSTSGFIATFRIYGCFGFVELSNQTGSITDGSGDNSNYQDLSDCTWLIKGLQGKSIVLTFTSFATENRYDAVTVYDGDSNTTTPIAILSGTSLPAPIIGTQGQDMLVQFASDDSINDAGWTATFELSDNISVPVTTGEISSNETTQEVPSTTGVPLNLPPRSTTCKLYTSRNGPLRVPPGNDTAGTTESTIMVMDSFKVSQVDVVNVNGTHEYMGDLKFYLVAPSGQQTLIADRSCGDSKTFLFSFTDYAESNSWSCPPDGGEWKPDSPLIDLSGISSEGIWKLEVEDVSEQDFGELLGWELRLCGSISEEDNAVSSAQVLSTASALLLGAICLL